MIIFNEYSVLSLALMGGKIILFLFLCEGFFSTFKFNLLKGFLSYLFSVASINEVNFKFLNFLFKIDPKRDCTKK